MPRPTRNRTSRRVRWFTALAALSLGVTMAAAQPAEAKPDRRGPAQVSRYVALGDSYASGEGLAPYEDGTDSPPTNGCHRSKTQSYPELLEASTFRPFQNLTSVACSGAGTAALFADVPDRADEPAQLATVTPDTTTVTLSIGGNDAGFAQVLAGCIYSPSPDLQSSVAGQPGCKTAFDPLVSRQIAALSGRPGSPEVLGTIPIPDIIKAIHRQAPNATILVSGYPKLFGTKTTNKYGCQVGLLPIYIKGSDARWIRHKASDLNDAIRYGVRAGPSPRGRRALRQRGQEVRRPQHLRSAAAMDQLRRLRPRTLDRAGQLPPDGPRPVGVRVRLRRVRLARSPVLVDCSGEANVAQPKLGVGFLGAGPVTQAIHLPVLARLSQDFEVTHVNDISADVAASVAARVGAEYSTSSDALLDDPDVDVVAICSPHEFHAVQVIDACRAGKKAILCEKPFAMSGEEADEIAAVSAETGVPIIVGAMHGFDPGWQAACGHWGSLPETSHTIRSSIVLPPNPRFEDFATEVITRPAPMPSDLTDVEVQARMVHDGVVTLAIHDLPLIRRWCPGSTIWWCTARTRWRPSAIRSS